MKYTYCIWDFNGTILNDVELGIFSINELLSKHGIANTLSVESYKARFRFPVIDYYVELGFDFEKTPYEELAKEWVKIYLDNFSRARLFDDVIPTLEFFKSNRVKQSVLSAAEQGMLRSQIEGFGICGYFEEIKGIDNIYASSKLANAREWRKKHPDEKVIFIGDTTHDIETAIELGADCYIVCAGHQSRERFDGCNVKIFSTLTELVSSLS